MSSLRKLGDGIDVGALVEQLDAQPDLWNEHSQRLVAPGSPHAGSSDIWIRYRAFDELTYPAAYHEPHFAVNYRAWHALPALRPIVFGLMRHVEAVYLGGILITRIPPGGQILPHDDRGSWHAEYLNRKVYVPLRANEGCVNRCEEQAETLRVGEAWSFDNLRVHSVENNGDTDRVTLIVCMRVEDGEGG